MTAHTGDNFRFVFSGNSFPEDLTPYRLVVHCGGCMLNQRNKPVPQAAAQAFLHTAY
ncbi:MAG: hypothetical protein ACLSFT_11315 [Ruminococcus callidus]